MFKFSGVTVNFKKLIKGSLIQDEQGNCYIGTLLDNINDSNGKQIIISGKQIGKIKNRFKAMGFTMVIPETVSPGIEINGKWYFAGDILKYPDCVVHSGEFGTNYEEFENTGVIEWDESHAQFYVTNRESVDLEIFWEDIGECIIIGNKWDNKELLGEQNDRK